LQIRTGLGRRGRTTTMDAVLAMLVI
jgi:hypothetical protein